MTMKRYDAEEVTDKDGTYTPDMEECVDGAYVLYDDVINVLRDLAQNGDLNKEAMNIILDAMVNE